MGKKSTPKAPTPPDPVAVAQAQSEANTQSAVTQAGLNRIEQVTPEGSLSYSQIGTDANGIPQYRQTFQYSPEQQALYDQQNQIAQSLGGLAQDNIGRVAQAQSVPFSYNGMTPLANQVSAPPVSYAFGGGPPVQRSYDQGGTFARSVAPGGPLASGVNPGDVQSGIGGAGDVTRGVSQGQIQGSVGDGGPLSRNVAQGNIQSGVANAGRLYRNVAQGAIQGDLNYTNLEAMPNPASFDQSARASADAMYNQAASRLDPAFAQRESDTRSRLANQGISENSDAYRRELDNFSRDRNDAYNQAGYSAIGAGLAAQQQGYGQALSTRQQGVGEANTQGQFFNAAQNQQFGQRQQNAALNNSAQNQYFGQNLQQGQFYNQAQGQQFGQGLQNAALNNQAQGQFFDQGFQQGQFANAAQNQQFGQGQQNAALNNQAQGQIFGQNAQQGQFYNAAQAQRFGQGQSNALLNNSAQGQQFQQGIQGAQYGMAAQAQAYDQSSQNAGFYNTAQQQLYDQNRSDTAFNNTAQNQQFNQNLTNAQLQNATRQQEIDEAAYLRNMPLNDIAALLGTGGGVQQPNFSPFAQVGVAAPDYQGAVYNNYNALNQQYQSKLQARSQGLGSIFGTLGQIGGAAILASDARLKHGVKRIGQLANGLRTYAFKYIGSNAVQFGVMAQEVLATVPDAVVAMPNGYLAVDYRKVW